MILPRSFAIFLLCALALLSSLLPAAAAEFSVPGRVSQGHAFPDSVQDTRPFVLTAWMQAPSACPLTRGCSAFKGQESST